MSPAGEQEIRAFVLGELAEPLRAVGLTPETVPDDFDVLLEGVIDSLGIMEMVVSAEERFGVDLDVEELDIDQLTLVGPFCRYVERKSREKVGG